MGRILSKALNAILNKNMNELQEMLTYMETLPKEEQKSYLDQALEKRKRYQTKIEKQLAKYEKRSEGKGWDFSGNLDYAGVFEENEVLLLRTVQECDKEFYIEIKRENSEEPQKYDDKEFTDVIWMETKMKNSFWCAVIRKEDQQFLGYVSVKDTAANLWEIAIEFLSPYCHNGYGTAALAMFLKKISSITGKNQFQALVETDNIPSQKLMEKLGAELIDIYAYAFAFEEDAEEFEEENLHEITERMIELAERLEVEPRKLLSHVLDYRLYVKG